MARKKPILLLQMQRMGDLILSYPLLLWLERTYPGHQLVVAAEQGFFSPLMKISPKAVYCPWSDTDSLLKQDYELVINLSVRQEAAQLAGKVDAPRKLGPVAGEKGRYVRGQWQLYRTSLVNNNKYNLFHWADLNALGVVSLQRIRDTRFAPPRELPPEVNKVGLFLGASEKAKRPAAEFWAELVHALLDRGLRPVLFGGPAETVLGQEVEKKFNGPVLNYCGKLELDELAAVGQTLQLFITPDTGPMHLAAWTGLKCLNLSMGNVNPWETGPYQPGHYVLRADMDCAFGCWSCDKASLDCHKPFSPGRIAYLASLLTIRKEPEQNLARLELPGLALFRTGRDARGLYNLDRIAEKKPDEQELLSRFWQAFFGWTFGLWDETGPKHAWKKLAGAETKAPEELVAFLPKVGEAFTTSLKNRTALDETFWAAGPDALKPFTGYAQMFLQNGEYSAKTWDRTLNILERLTSTTS